VFSTTFNSQDNRKARAAGPPCMNKIVKEGKAVKRMLEVVKMSLCGRRTVRCG
jgi:hypothetical protein